MPHTDPRAHAVLYLATAKPSLPNTLVLRVARCFDAGVILANRHIQPRHHAAVVRARGFRVVLVALFPLGAHVRRLRRDHPFLDQLPKVFPRVSENIKIGGVVLFHQGQRCIRDVDWLRVALFGVDGVDLIKPVEGDVESDTEEQFQPFVLVVKRDRERAGLYVVLRWQQVAIVDVTVLVFHVVLA